MKEWNKNNLYVCDAFFPLIYWASLVQNSSCNKLLQWFRSNVSNCIKSSTDRDPGNMLICLLRTPSTFCLLFSSLPLLSNSFKDCQLIRSTAWHFPRASMAEFSKSQKTVPISGHIMAELLFFMSTKCLHNSQIWPVGVCLPFSFRPLVDIVSSQSQHGQFFYFFLKQITAFWCYLAWASAFTSLPSNAVRSVDLD